MTLGDVYKGKSFTGIDNAEQYIKKTLRKRSENKWYKGLEQDLNDYFYGEYKAANHNNVREINKFVQLELDKNAEFILENLINFDFSKIKDQKTDEKYMNVATLKTAVVNMEQKIKLLNSGINNLAKDKQYIANQLKDLKHLCESGNNLINNSVGKGYTQFRDSNDLKNAKNIYNRLYNYDKALDQLSSFKKQRNKALELGIKEFGENYNNYIKFRTNQMIEDAIGTAKLTGDQLTGNNGLIKARVEFSDNEKEIEKVKTKQSSSENVELITTYNADSPRFMKADVKLKLALPGNTQNFNVSIKNWGGSKGYFGHLGSTNLLYAITRSSKLPSTYSLMALRNSETARFKAFTELCVAADIIAGFSQKNDFADTLVINTRTKIKVINIASLILDNMDNLSIILSKDNLMDKAQEIMKSKLMMSQRYHRTLTYSQFYYGYLYGIIASVKLNPQLYLKD